MLTNREVARQRGWARVAGLMFWVVLIADIAGMQIHSAVGRSLMLAGSLCTIPLALGLFYALRPVQPLLAAGGLACRLLEATLGIISIVVGYDGVAAQLSGPGLGQMLLRVAHWDHSTSFSAFIFTIGSTLFFYLFVVSGSIPRILSWWGLFSSALALSACVAHLFHPAFPAMTMYAWIPLLLAETSTGLWLLIKSVSVNHTGLSRGRFAPAPANG